MTIQGGDPHRTAMFDALDRVREKAGFLRLRETVALADRGNLVFDPFSTLISRDARIGTGNVFHPNTRLACSGGAVLEIGSGNVLHGNTVIEATAGAILIGDRNQFGDGVVVIKANAPGARIEIGSRGRYCGIVSVYGRTLLGDGSQILGSITAHDCSLGAGHAHDHPVPDERGAVLKGAGTARGIHLAVGQVIDGWGAFRGSDATDQSRFHPPAPARDG